MKHTHKILSALFAGVTAITLTTSEVHAHSKEFSPEFVTTLVQPYLAIQQGLAGDRLEEAKAGATAFVKSMANAPQTGDAREESDALITPAKAITEASDIADARKAFQTLTQEFTTLLRHMGTTRTEPLFLVHCPMAFDNTGADWVQSDKTVANPYFGASMLRCGSIKAEISSTGTHTGKTGAGHEAHH